MQKYVKKLSGLVVEAVQLTEDNVSEVSNWANGAQIVEEKNALNHDDVSEGLNVKTPSGKQRASKGMYVIRYDDNFYVSGPDRFEKAYRLLDETPKTVPEHLLTEKPTKNIVTDPFEGMTRFGEGSKP